jgi:hypothetical protein
VRRWWIATALVAASAGLAFGPGEGRGQLWTPWTHGTPAAAAAPLALDVHNVAAQAGTSVLTNSVTTTAVTSGDQAIILWSYCTDGSCANATNMSGLTITSNISGETCTQIANASALLNAGGANYFGVGAAFCSGGAGGSDTITLTATGPATLSYLSIFTTYWKNANGQDTACAATGSSGTQAAPVTSWSITAAGATTAANGAAIGIAMASAGSAGMTTFTSPALRIDYTAQISNGYTGGLASGTTPTNSGTGASGHFHNNIVCLKSM